MVCVYCSGNTEVINSRMQKRNNTVWRRRKCRVCQAIFSSREETQYNAVWLIKTKDAQLSPFLRDKLFLSLYRSCQHRSSSLKDAAALAETVTANLIGRTDSGVLDSLTIKQAAQVALNRFDKAASTHYAAFHKS
jgi:transcriptional repressor NrdR